MSRYGNLKSGPDNTVTPEDMRCWRDLVRLSKAAAAGDAGKPASALVSTARAAKNACAPGVVTKDNPFVRLSRLANRYAGETAGGRREMQAELGLAALKAAEILENSEAEEPRVRKDIHG